MNAGEAPKREPVLASELIAKLAQDPEYVARADELSAEIARQSLMLHQAEAPIVSDLLAAGVELESVWDLVNSAEPYVAALPILLKHFVLGVYPSRVMESLGRALAVKQAVEYWDDLEASYRSPRSEGEEAGAAVALAACATRRQLDSLLDLASLPERGTSRVLLLRPIKRLGRERGAEFLLTVTSDPDLGQEATALLARSKH